MNKDELVDYCKEAGQTISELDYKNRILEKENQKLKKQLEETEKCLKDMFHINIENDKESEKAKANRTVPLSHGRDQSWMAPGPRYVRPLSRSVPAWSSALTASTSRCAPSSAARSPARTDAQSSARTAPPQSHAHTARPSTVAMAPPLSLLLLLLSPGAGHVPTALGTPSVAVTGGVAPAKTTVGRAGAGVCHASGRCAVAAVGGSDGGSAAGWAHCAQTHAASASWARCAAVSRALVGC